MIRRNLLIEQLEPRTHLSASLVKDINTTQLTTLWLFSSAVAGDTVFLSQDDGVAGWELYKTDGTTGGTVLVKDVRPGRDNSQPGWLTPAAGNTIFFTANDGAHGVELWKSDGTTGGTVMVKDINPGAASSSPGSLVYINGTVYFSASDGANGFELWKSDGTEGGTVMVKNIWTGTSGIPAMPASSSPTQLINNNGTLFFRAATFESGFELWKSDGTEGGTVQVTELYNNNNDGMANTAMVALNGFVYYAGRTSTGAIDLWRSDGTGPGTTLVKDFASNVFPGKIRTSGGRVFFTASQSGNQDFELWRTDGTTTANVVTTGVLGLIDVNGSLYFGSGGTLYKADATTLTPLRSGLTFNASTAPSWANANGTLFFGANDGSGIGDELWKSNSATGVTELVKDIESGPTSAGPFAFIPYGPGGSSGVIFGTFNGPTGGALFKSDGTGPGTVMIKDVYPGTDSSSPTLMTPLNGWMYFIAFEPGFGATGGGELYRTDGTEAGTSRVADLNPGATGASIGSLRVFGNHLYFAANNGSGIGTELWRTDGTSVTLVKDINPSGNSSPGFGVVSGSHMYFSATTAVEGTELWRTDGTNGGTQIVGNLATGSASSSPSLLTDVGGTLYFTTSGALWKVTGTGAATQVAGIGSITSLINVNGTLYISGTSPAGGGAELYKLAPGGTTPVLVKDIHTGGSSSPSNFTNVDGTLFFSATTSAAGAELWKSDGTEAGTVPVKDIRPGSTGSVGVQPQFVAANGVLYFRADNGVNGLELWRSDGTSDGTYLVKDITPPGAINGDPFRFFVANGFVYFAATDDDSANMELWRSDGTADGTAMVGDYFPEGSFFNNPANVGFLAGLDGEIYYAFTDDTHGRELWKAEQPDFAALGAGGALTISGTANNDVIDIADNGAGGLVVTLNGLTETFAAGAVTSINIVGRVGRDMVNVSAGTVTFNSDAGAATPNLTLRVASGASAVFNATQHLAELNVDGGTATLAAGGDKMLILDRLTITTLGSLFLNDNDLLIDYTDFNPYETVKGHVITGRNAPFGGIRTAVAGDTALAVVDNALFGRTIWNGESIDATTIIGKYTYFGDANLDGKVTGDDYLAVDANLGATSAQWFQGDFNFSGTVTGDDYLAIDANLGKGTLDPLAFAEDQEAMIALHAERYGGKTYIKAVEAAAKGHYKIRPMRSTGSSARR